MPCAKFIVNGRVQGVFFRASARAEALRLNVTGYAKNLADGSVEVFACGDASALDDLQRWLHSGPPAARVVSVYRSDTDEVATSGFQTS